MLVKATKLGYYGNSLRYPGGKPFDYIHSLKKGEEMSPTALKAKTKEDVEKSDWLKPVTVSSAKTTGDSDDKSQEE